MRGQDEKQGFMYTCLSPEQRAPTNHPLRPIQAFADFDAVVREARKQDLLSDEHFTVDGTLIDAWASMKSFQPKETANDTGNPPTGGGRNATMDFKGEKRSNQTHQSTPGLDGRTTRHAGYAVSQRIR